MELPSENSNLNPIESHETKITLYNIVIFLSDIIEVNFLKNSSCSNFEGPEKTAQRINKVRRDCLAMNFQQGKIVWTRRVWRNIVLEKNRPGKN
jgi:hypothetical protein